MVVVKNFLAKIIYILIKDGHFTATSAACLSALSGYLFKLSVPATIHLIPFLGSEAIYSFNRYKEKKQDGLEKNKEDLLRKKNIFYPFFVLIIFFIFGYLLWLENIFLFLLGLIILGIGLFYTIFLKKITQKIPGFKNFFVSLCWSLIIFLPFVFKKNLSENIFPVLMVSLFVFINVMIFEIFLDFRDIKQDKKNNLSTFPLVMNKKNLFYFLFFLNFFSLMPILLGLFIGILPIISIVLLFSLFYNLFFLLIIMKKIIIKKYLFEFMVDFNKILWFLLVFFISNIFYV